MNKDAIVAWLKTSAETLKTNLPGVIRNYPLSSVTLMIVGGLVWAIVQWVF